MNSNFDCETIIRDETKPAIKKLFEAMTNMAANYNDDVEYTKAYAAFGKAAITNQVTLSIALGMTGDGADLVFVTQGTIFKTRVTHFKMAQEQWQFIRPSATAAPAYLDPVFKASRFHGIITLNSVPGLGSP